MVKRKPGAGKEFEIPFMLPHAPLVNLENPVRILQGYFFPWTDEAKKLDIRVEGDAEQRTLRISDWTQPLPEWAYKKVWKSQRSARLRQAAGEFLISIKARESSDEWEHPIPEEIFRRLWALTTEKLRKVRYHVPYAGGGAIEVDCWDWGVWRGEYEDTEARVNAFALPDWASQGIVVKEHPVFGSTRNMVELGRNDLRKEIGKLFRDRMSSK